MTVLYNSKNHWRVVTGRNGSVYFLTLRPLAFSTALYLLLWFIDKYVYTLVEDPSSRFSGSIDVDDVSDGLISRYGSYIYNVLMMLLLVTYFNTALRRYFSAGQSLAKFHFLCQDFSSLVVACTGLDDSERAIEWRDKLRTALVQFIATANHNIDEPTTVLDLTMNRNNKASEHKEKDTNALINVIAGIIHEQDKYLREPLIIPTEMKLHHKISEISICLADVYAVINTQFPFMLANCTFVLVYFWISLVPFSQPSYFLAYLPLLWLDVSSRIGLIFVAAEITDPFGMQNVNDLDVNLYLKKTVTIVNRKLSQKAIESSHMVSAHDFRAENHRFNPVHPFINPSISNKGTSGNVYQEQGMADLQAGYLSRAIDNLQRSAEHSLDDDLVMLNMEMIGDINAVKYIVDDAILYYNKAYTASIKANTFHWERNNHALRIKKKICDLYFDEKNYQLALKHCLELIDLEIEEGRYDENNLALLRHRTGLLLYYSDDFSGAIQQFWMSLKLFRNRNMKNDSYLKLTDDTNDKNDLINDASFLYCLGLTHEERKEYKMAIRRLLESFAIQQQVSENSDVVDMTASTLARLARCYSKLGEKEESERFMESARSIALQLQKRPSAKENSPNSDKSVWEVTRIIMNERYNRANNSVQSQAGMESREDNSKGTLDTPFTQHEFSFFMQRSLSCLEGLNK